MQLDPREFKAIGTPLAIGKRVRADHSCGDGRTLVVSKNAAGVSAYCHRCHAKGFVPTTISLAERIARLAAGTTADTEAQQQLDPPAPAVTDPQEWPDAARLWLYMGGFSNDEIKKHGWYWNPRMQRVILPVRKDGQTIYWQGRGFDKDRQKALNPVVNREGLVVEFGDAACPWVAVTEDILSAAKVGGVGRAMALLGTVLARSTALSLADDGRPVFLMLDDDPAGRRGAAQASKLLSVLGVKHWQVYFGKDPKLVPRAEILNRIQELLT